MIVYLILVGLFLHIIADYILQTSFMANTKQRKWWKDNYPDEKYRFDWLIMLFLHSFEWTVCVMLPIALYRIFTVGTSLVEAILVSAFVVINTVIHMWIDDMKANQLRISLTQDQLVHIVQIIITTLILYFI